MVAADADANRTTMNIVMLSDLSDFGLNMLRELAQAGVSVETVVTARPRPLLERLKRMTSAVGYRATAAEILRRVRAKWTHRKSAGQSLPLATTVISVSGFNAPDCVQLLQRIQPDLIVLGGAPILKDEVLQTARLGVLNAHPGLLPKYRGVDVVPWAILNDDPVGVTVHRVDRGIDTGAPIRLQEIELQPGDNLDRIRQRAAMVSIKMMAAVVAETTIHGALPDSPPAANTARYPLCRRMPRDLVRRVEDKLRLRVSINVSPVI